ncbi:MAG: hypothetical protein Q9173_005897 [Seirophora scorigena]
MPDGTWKREGPEVMMVPLDSARQWSHREQLIACHTDHSQIAKIKRGQGGAYPDIKWAIQKAMLSAGDLYNETDSRRIPMSQAHEPGRSPDGRDRLMKRPSMHLEARSYRPVEGQMKLQAEEMVDQEDGGNPEEYQWRSPRLPSSSVRHPHADQKVSQWRLGQAYDERADALRPKSPSVSSDSALASTVSELHKTATKVPESTTTIDKESDHLRMYSPAGRRDHAHFASTKPAFPMNLKEVEVMGRHNHAVPPTTPSDNVALANFGLTAEAGEVSETGRREDRIISSSAATPQTSHDRQYEETSSTRNQNVAPKSTEPRTKRTQYDGWLKYASNWGNIEETQTSLATYYDVNCKDENGRSPLHDAAFSRNEPIVKLLLEKGAHPRAKADDGTTSLHIINAMAAAQIPLTETLTHLLLPNRPPLEKADNEGMTPLMYAARRGELLIATKLICCGASTQIKDEFGRTALHHAAMRVTEPEMITLLTKEGALIDAKTEHMRTPLHFAAENPADPVKVVECLLQAGADIEARSYTGSTPLRLAVEKGNANCLELLLRFGAKIEARDRKRDTSLHAAVGRGKLSSVKSLLDHGANPLARDARSLVGRIPRDYPLGSGVTKEMQQEIDEMLIEADAAWKRSGKKYSRWPIPGR